VRVEKWNNSLAIRLPVSVVEAFNLKEGDEIEIQAIDKRGSPDRAIPCVKSCQGAFESFTAGLPRISSSTEMRPMPGSIPDASVLLHAHPATPAKVDTELDISRLCAKREHARALPDRLQ
jgi:antitoxin MazE